MGRIMLEREPFARVGRVMDYWHLDCRGKHPVVLNYVSGFIKTKGRKDTP